MAIYSGANGPQSSTGVYQTGDVYWDTAITKWLLVFVYDSPHGWTQVTPTVDSIVATRRFFAQTNNFLPPLIYGDIFLDNFSHDVKMWDNISWISIATNNRSLQPATQTTALPSNTASSNTASSNTTLPSNTRPSTGMNHLLRQIFEGINSPPTNYSHQDIWWGDFLIFSFMLIYDGTKGLTNWVHVSLTNPSVVAGVQFYPAPNIQALSHLSFAGGDVWIETQDGNIIDDVLIWDDTASVWFQPNSNRTVSMTTLPTSGNSAPIGYPLQPPQGYATSPQITSAASTASINIGGPHTPQLLSITSQTGDLLVEIDVLGNITYGSTYTPDAAAKFFWEAISIHCPATTAQNENITLKQLNADLLKRLEKYEPSSPGTPVHSDDAYSRAMKIIK